MVRLTGFGGKCFKGGYPSRDSPPATPEKAERFQNAIKIISAIFCCLFADFSPLFGSLLQLFISNFPCPYQLGKKHFLNIKMLQYGMDVATHRNHYKDMR